MATDSKLMARAMQQYEQDVQRRKEEYRTRVETICRRIPRIEEINLELRSTVSQIVASAFRRGTDPSPTIAALKEHNLTLQRERAELLVRGGYPFDALEEKPACPRCEDRGYYNGAPCRCLMAYYTREQNRELSKLLDLGSQSFDTFSMHWYSNRYYPEYQANPRENMEVIYDICANYAHNFARHKDNLLMSGRPGLGKTFLSACIAREVSDAGFSVVYDTAIHIFSQFESSKFGRENPYDEDSGTDINRCLNCDLLIMDDLGAEMPSAFVTSAFYQLINTRLMTGKRTIVSTNLSLEEIDKRYGAAIASRLAGEYQLLTFFGEDIRQLKRNQ